jgi:hypothetical protein
MDSNQYQLLLKQAVSGNYYMKVTDLKTKWKITGAVRKFKLDPEVMFVPQFRLVGKRHELTYFLEKLGYTPDQIQNILSLSYTSNNYNVPESQGGRKESFDVEVKSSKPKRQSQQSKSSSMTFNDLYNMLKSCK